VQTTIESIGALIESLKPELEDAAAVSEDLENQTINKIEELETVKEQFGNVATATEASLSVLADCLTTLEGLQDVLDEYDEAQTIAANHEIGAY
tara:strand:+ start:502 stop:783 length:282 start_codon:yes stop_codon:yes gene_type:complete